MSRRVGHRFLHLFVVSKPIPFARGNPDGFGLNFNLNGGREIKR
jgi:hypothetical protein